MKHRAVVAVVIVVTLLAGGCWNRREPDQVGVVIALGVDVDEESGDHRVIAKIAEPLGLGGGGDGGGGGGGTQRPAFVTISARGRTMFEAMQNLGLHITRELTFAHVEVIIFSEAAARRGLQPTLDVLARERDLRLITRPVVAEGDVEKLLGLQFNLEQIGGQALSRQLLSSERTRGIVINRELRLFFQAIALPGRQPLLPRVKVYEGDEVDASEPDSPTPAEIVGAAAFRDASMVGWLTGNQVRGWAWLVSEVQRATLVVDAPGSGVPFSIEITDTRSRLEPVIDGDRVRVKVLTTAEGRIQDQHFYATYREETDFTLAMAAAVAEAIKDDIESALQRAQELRTDIFGFGNLIYRTMPREWTRLEDGWDDDILPRITLDLDIRVDIRRVGYMLKGTVGGER